MQVSFEEFLREVTAEVCVMLALRGEKNVRKVRGAAGKLAENEELLAALAGLAWPGEDLAGEVPPEWSGPAGVPSWHPEHRLNESEA